MCSTISKRISFDDAFPSRYYCVHCTINSLVIHYVGRGSSGSLNNWLDDLCLIVCRLCRIGTGLINGHRWTQLDDCLSTCLCVSPPPTHTTLLSICRIANRSGNRYHSVCGFVSLCNSSQVPHLCCVSIITRPKWIGAYIFWEEIWSISNFNVASRRQ